MSLRKSLLSFALLLGISLAASAQIKPVEDFLKANKDLSKYFIYQSTLRMLNQDGDPDFNRLIKDIRKINVYIAMEEGVAVSKQSHQKMLDDLTAVKFETLVSAKMDGALINLMSKEEGDRAYYVLAASEEANFALLEMDGRLDLRYLQSLEKFDFNKLRKLVGQDVNSDSTEEH